MPFPQTDWGDWTPDEYQVDAPATSLHFERWFRNPVAMAQGALGAPRISPKALGGSFLAVGNNTSGSITLTDVAWVRSFKLFVGLSNPSPAQQFQMSFSTNGGSSWGAWVNTGLITQSGELTSYVLVIDAVAGTRAWMRFGAPSSGSGTFTVTANYDAIRFQMSGTTAYSVAVFCEEGRDDV